ncbi:MAG: NUDIX hydrolase [Chloroflexi bacterium]|nr:NUDIX hydrolase [Chloroflexota bacterium]
MPDYSPPLRDRPTMSVDVAILSLRENDLQVLLVRRGAAPFKGKWAIPGGFVKPDETLQAAAVRELEEETGVRDVYVEQLYTFGDPGRDPRGRVITVAYFALVPAHAAREPRGGDDAAEARWWSMYQLPDLAFDHAEILEYALQRLRNKLEYTAVGFQLLPAEFTLSELQTAYEIVLGEQLDKRNFRRRILEAKVIRETRKYREGVGGRPAKLYRYREERRGGCFRKRAVWQAEVNAIEYRQR